HFRRFKVEITGISTDNLDDLKELVTENNLSFPVLSDNDFVATEAYGTPIHENDEIYQDHGKHNDPAYFLVDENGQILYLHKLTGPLGRPSAEVLIKTVKFIKKQKI